LPLKNSYLKKQTDFSLKKVTKIFFFLKSAHISITFPIFVLLLISGTLVIKFRKKDFITVSALLEKKQF